MAPISCHIASTSLSNMDTEIPAINSAFSWDHFMCNRGRKWRKVEILSLRKLPISLTHFLLHCIGQKLVTWPQVAKEVEKYSFCSQGRSTCPAKNNGFSHYGRKEKGYWGAVWKHLFRSGPPPFWPPKELFCTYAVGEVSLTSGVLILPLYPSRAHLLPLTLSLECLGKTASIYSAWQTLGALLRGPSTSYVRTELHQDLWGTGSREAALCGSHLQSWACSRVVRVVPREMRRTQSRRWASICSLLPSRNHWRQKKTPCACSRFSLTQLSVSQGIKCGQWNQPHRLVCKFIWKIPAKVPGKHFPLMLQVSFSFLSWNSTIWLWGHISTRQHDEKSLTRCLCCNVVTTSTVKYLKCVY